MNNTKYFKNLLANTIVSIKNANKYISSAPSGSLLTVMRDGKLTYFQSNPIDGSRSRKSINNNPALISSLAHKAYYEAESAINEHNRKLLQKLSEEYIEPTFDNVIARLPSKYKRVPLEIFSTTDNIGFFCDMHGTNSTPYNTSNTQQNGTGNILGSSSPQLIKPMFITSEGFEPNKQPSPALLTYLRGNAHVVSTKQIIDTHRYSLDIIKWAEAPYLQSLYKKNLARIHNSSYNLSVRSKSELMLVEKYYHFKIPFHYDEIIIINNEILIPDFILPGKKYPFYFWEHCGMPSNPEYMKHHKNKLALYESVGIAPWTNLIVTYDDEYGNFDMQIIESEIRSKLL
ncbi:MAG: hypothetical protein IJP24_04505 [Firmicutes bacterium]|nr:hypothetical protein [Bacillota bacterium]MBQ9972767.1 hypothetical protein [Bacillota bacterium]